VGAENHGRRKGFGKKVVVLDDRFQEGWVDHMGLLKVNQVGPGEKVLQLRLEEVKRART